jgi:hypothetical protein
VFAVDGKKLLVSLAIEGKFASDGLQAIGEGDDILMAMARELVTEKGIGESADAVWKWLVERQAEVFGVQPVVTREPAVEAEPRVRDLPEVIIPPPAQISAVVTQPLTFGMCNQTVQRRKAAHKPTIAAAAPDQFALFNS